MKKQLRAPLLVRDNFFTLVILAIIVISVVININYSHLGMYHKLFYGDNAKDPSLIHSSVRLYRWDEWFVDTPILFSQVKVSYEPTNRNIGLEQDLAGISIFPTKSWKYVFHFNNLGFLLMPFSQAYSLSWQILLAAPIISIYFLFRLLTKSQLLGSLLSLAIFFTPFIHWWSFAPGLYLGYGTMSFLGFIGAVKLRFPAQKLLSYGISLYFMLCYIFRLYPPFQVPFAYFLILIGIGYLIHCGFFSGQPKKQIMKLGLIVVAYAIPVAGVLAYYVYDFGDVLMVMAQTAYPGARFETGGGFSWMLLLSGFFNLQLQEDFLAAGYFANQSEGATFFMISIFLLPVYLVTAFHQLRTRKYINPLFLLSLSYFLFVLYYMMVGIPAWLAQYSLLYLVPSKRMLFTLGIVNYFLAFFYLIQPRSAIPKYPWMKYVMLTSGTMMFVYNLSFGYYLKMNMPQYIQSDLKIIGISTISLLMVLTLAYRHKYTFAIIFLLFSFISSYKVNPIYRGTDIITNNPLAKEVQRIESENAEGARWATFGNWYGGRIALANGARMLNGVHLYPQLDLWYMLDKEKKYKDIYNRYANIVFLDGPSDRFRFYLVSGGDNFFLDINPCHEFFDEVNVRYYLMDREVDYACLKRISNNYHIYYRE